MQRAQIKAHEAGVSIEKVAIVQEFMSGGENAKKRVGVGGGGY